jgi:hypothetical protein
MLQVMVVSALASVAFDAEAVKNLSAAAEKLVQAESYTFEVVTQSEGGGGFPGGGGPPGSDEPVKGAYQKAQPVHLKRGSTEVYRGDGTSLYKGEDGKWQKVSQPTRGDFGGRRGGDRPPGGGGDDAGPEGGRRRGRGGDAGGDEGGAGGAGGEGGEGGDPGAEGGRRRGRGGEGGEGGEAGGRRGRGPSAGFAAFSVSSTPVPHAMLLDIGKKVESVMAEKSGQKTLYVGKLTPAAALELSGGSSGRGGNPPEATGTIRITTDSAGAIEKIELDSRTKFTFGEGREFERTRKTTITVSGLGKTKVDVPKEVTEQLKML